MSSRLLRDEALEKEDRKDEMKNKNIKQSTRPAPAASTAGPWPTICQSSKTPRHWKLPKPSPDPTTHYAFYDQTRKIPIQITK